jgi:hypothetical protein
MSLVLADRVQETATANTTVSFTMLGAVTGYQSFATVGNTNTTYYAATDNSGNWEVGLGTYSTTGPTLTRTTILSSSASGSAVTFSGTVTVFLTYPSERSVYLTSATAANPSNQGGISFGTLNYYDTYILQSLQGSNNGYVYANIQNTSSGGIATADFAIYNDQAGTRYINVGVNSSGYGTSTGLLTTGGASSTTATVTVSTGNLLNYAVITGTGIPAGAYIVTQLTSTATAKATATQTSGGTTGSTFFQISSLAGIQIGYLISGTGIPNGTYVGSFNGANNGINLVNAAGSSVTTTANATGTYNFYEPGNTGTYQTSVAITSSGTSITAQVPGSYNQPNNGYIYSYGGDIVIGTLTANAFHVVANNSNTDSITVSSAGAVSFPSGAVSFPGTTALFAAIPTNIAETVNIVAGAINSTPTAYFNTGAVQVYTTAAGANWTQNLAFSSGTTMNSALATNQAATIAIIALQGTTAYYMNGTLTIDGSSTGVTTYWQGGTAPTKGNASGYDVYTYTVIKTASSTYTVLCSLTQF